MHIDDRFVELVDLFDSYLGTIDFLLKLVVSGSGLFSIIIVVLAYSYVSHMKSVVNDEVKNYIKRNDGFKNMVIDNIQEEVAKAFDKGQVSRFNKKENKEDKGNNENKEDRGNKENNIKTKDKKSTIWKK